MNITDMNSTEKINNPESKKRKKMLEIRQEIIKNENTYLMSYAAKSENAWREKQHDLADDLRPPYIIDRDKIIYSGAFRRYQGKTQVVYFPNTVTGVASNRSIHAFYVTNVAMSIGRYLGLNVDLIQAMALGHDLGHAPFGHDGEKMVSKNWEKYENREFHHNIQSYYIVDHIAYNGRGLNLTLQVKDGIICHDGEVKNSRLKPDLLKKPHDRLMEIQNYIAEKEKGNKPKIIPWTLEGCVVRVSDVIAYIGQDIEDAIRLGFINRDDVPDYLGQTNGEIIDNLSFDLISNSFGNDWIGFTDETSEKLELLKAWNYKNIYLSDVINRHTLKLERCFQVLYEIFRNDLINENRDSRIYKDFLDDKVEAYLENTSIDYKLKDFMSGMSDNYVIECMKDYFIPDI